MKRLVYGVRAVAMALLLSMLTVTAAFADDQGVDLEEPGRLVTPAVAISPVSPVFFVPPGQPGCPEGWRPVTPPVSPQLICLPDAIVIETPLEG
jgi:hypothetical protein